MDVGLLEGSGINYKSRNLISVLPTCMWEEICFTQRTLLAGEQVRGMFNLSTPIRVVEMSQPG